MSEAQSVGRSRLGRASGALTRRHGALIMQGCKGETGL
jgi:hypothetical protein